MWEAEAGWGMWISKWTWEWWNRTWIRAEEVTGTGKCDYNRGGRILTAINNADRTVHKQDQTLF